MSLVYWTVLKKQYHTYHNYILFAHSSPLSFKDITALGMSCMADYGGPVFPFLAVGGYEGKAQN